MRRRRCDGRSGVGSRASGDPAVRAPHVDASWRRHHQVELGALRHPWIGDQPAEERHRRWNARRWQRRTDRGLPVALLAGARREVVYVHRVRTVRSACRGHIPRHRCHADHSVDRGHPSVGVPLGDLHAPTGDGRRSGAEPATRHCHRRGAATRRGRAPGRDERRRQADPATLPRDRLCTVRRR
jgi:hypothetical protein